RLDSIIHFRSDKLTPGIKHALETFFWPGAIDFWNRKTDYFQFPLKMDVKIHQDARYDHVKNVDI
ncbi:MAG: hypothetical protein KDD34_03580, partial [Bdellovibrionales bacterium]|nr:hypothetical protein [Bdellovibrionales bacterium]